MWQNEPKSIEDYMGFIYLIINKVNGRKYVGKKIFWNKRKSKPLKGKKRCRRSIHESDWREYNGSSKELLQDIDKFGIQKFDKIIIKLCKNKWEMAYYEAKYQFDNDVLLDKNWYNGWISVKLGKQNEQRTSEKQV